MSELPPNFVKIDPVYFEKLMGEPLWDMTDAVLYLLAIKSTASQTEKMNFLKEEPTAQQVINYLDDARTMGISGLNSYDSFMSIVDDPEFIFNVKDSIFTAILKPDAFVEWAKKLPISLPIFEMQPVKNEMSEKERISLLKIIIGVAVNQYDFDPNKKRNAATKQISDDLLYLGIALDEDTIRKYLKEASALLPSDWNKDS